MTADQLQAKLKELAPNVAFDVQLTPDHDFRWDGDGPDPEDDGYTAHDVEIAALAVHQGNMLSGESSMGGHYVNPDKPDPDLGGYLPQMLQEAGETLAQQLPDNDPKRDELRKVYDFLKQEMRDRYDRQRQEIEFIDYVLSFYGTGSDLYPMGATESMVREATRILIDRGDDVAFDSVDREKVRDIMIEKFGLVFPTK